MIRFCRKAVDPQYLLFLEVVQTLDPPSMIQTTIFSSDPANADKTPNLSKFCFPQTNFDPSPQITSSASADLSPKDNICIVFYLKSNDSFPTYGYVIQRRSKVKPNERTAYCLLSPFFNPDKFFHIITKFIEEGQMNGVNFLRRNVKPVINPKASYNEEREIIDNSITDIMNLLEPYFIGLIIVYLVIDFRIIITSSDFEKIWRYTFAILSMIHPLPWPGVFISALPESTVDTILAPFPYIIGLHNSLANNAHTPDVESHILVNADSKMMSIHPEPFKFPSKVEKAIELFKKKVIESKTSNSSSTNTTAATTNSTSISQNGCDKYVFSKLVHELVLEVISIGIGKPANKPDKLYQAWDKMSKNPKLDKFPSMICSSQLVLQLMREVELGQKSEIYNEYWFPEEKIVPEAEICPINRKDGPENGTLEEISRLAATFASRFSGDIEEHIRNRKTTFLGRRAMTQVERPEALSFTNKVQMYGGALTGGASSSSSATTFALPPAIPSGKPNVHPPIASPSKTNSVTVMMTRTTSNGAQNPPQLTKINPRQPSSVIQSGNDRKKIAKSVFGLKKKKDQLE